VAKGQTRFTGFDDKIVSMYARGMSTREITGHLEEIYGVEVSPTLISTVTEAVMEEVKGWQGRPLETVYPIVYLDAFYVKIRDAGHIRNRAIYVAIGVNLTGNKEVLGLWTGEAEGAKFWLQVLTDLKNRGVADIFIACVDGLTGFPKAIETVFPQAQVQLCHSASGARVAELCLVETAQGSRRGSAVDLSSHHGRRRLFQPGGIRGKMGRCVSHDQSDVAPELGAADTILCLPGRHSESDLHDQCDRVTEHVAAQSDQDPGIIPQSGGGAEVTVGAGAHCQEVDDARAGLESGLAAVCDSAR
jgi:mutator family transposase